MAISGKKLSELTQKLEELQGTERIYVTDGSGTQKYIETNQLATSKQLEEKASKDEIPDVSGFITSTQADGKYATLEQIGSIDAILDSINGESV